MQITPSRSITSIYLVWKISLLSLIFAALNATFSDLAQAQETTFDEWKIKQMQEFQDFRTEEDKAFIKFLEREWKQFEIFKGGSRDTVRKPPVAPVVRDILSGTPIDRKTTNVFTRRIDAIENTNSFFGHTLTPLTFPVSHLRNLESPKKEVIANAWSDLSKVQHSDIISAIQSYRKTLELGDWGLIRLIDYLLKIQITDGNSRTCYAWFLLNKLGYDVKLGYTRSALILLLPTISNTYGVEYTLIDGQKHYLYSTPESEELMSYDGHYRDNQQQLDFSLKTLIRASSAKATRELKYTLDNEEYNYKFDYDAGLREFLWSYPQLDLAEYFHSAPNNPVLASLRDQLKPKIENKTSRESINFLLHFIQTLFEYQTDIEQFGKEKYMIIEESLHFGINDCEDRSIFLAWLINSLLDLKVLVLDYPGHVAVAVRTSIKHSDDFVEFQGSKYLIVDPTYLGAQAGKAMPEFKNSIPQIISTTYQ